ncbi:hypothetical protein ABPG72_011401 [Tetrahymena utriculariae]
MDKDLHCDIHNKCLVQLIDMLQGSTKKLQCVQCVSNKIQEMGFIYIPQITNLEENIFLDNWPPLTDEELRKKIIKLKNDNEDINQKVIDFYDQLTQEIIKIISEKKKEQLIQISKALEIKEKIIDQYCKMASLDKISQCFVKESQKYEDVEQKLKEQIDSQFDRIEEYTSILQSMMKQYELVSLLDVQNPTYIKDNVIKILKIINLFPQNNFDFEDQMINLDNINSYQEKLEQEYEIHKKDNIKIDILINQLELCNKQLTSKMNQLDWYLDDFLLNQQILITENQTDNTEFINDIYLNLFQSQFLLKKNIDSCSKPSYKYFNQFKKDLRLQSQNIVYSSYNNSSYYIQGYLDSQGKIQIKRSKNGNSFVGCFLNYVLKPDKKYVFRINLYKSENASKFYIGLSRPQNLHNSNLSLNGIGFNTSQISQNQNLENQSVNRLALEFRVCIQDQYLECRDYPNGSKVLKLDNKNSIIVNEQYYFGFEFTNDQIQDQLEVFDYQELDEFPNN